MFSTFANLAENPKIKIIEFNMRLRHIEWSELDKQSQRQFVGLRLRYLVT